MQLFLVYFPAYKDASPDYLFGIYEAEDLALKAIEESNYSNEDKRLFYIDIAFLNSRI